MNTLMVTLLFLVGTALHAYADAYKDNTGKRNHIFRALMVVAYVASGYFSLVPVLYMVCLCCLVRIAFFNPLYNTFTDRPTFSLGTTDPIYDKLLLKLPTGIVFTIHLISLFLLLVINIYLWSNG